MKTMLIGITLFFSFLAIAVGQTPIYYGQQYGGGYGAAGCSGQYSAPMAAGCSGQYSAPMYAAPVYQAQAMAPVYGITGYAPVAAGCARASYGAAGVARRPLWGFPLLTGMRANQAARAQYAAACAGS